MNARIARGEAKPRANFDGDGPPPALVLRRLRFVVPFPFPDVQLRTELWRRVFPPDAPAARLEHARLARLQLTGANIKTVALKAAFHARREDAPVGMRHILRAARDEFAKLELPFPEAEVRAWGTSIQRTSE